MPPSLDGPVKAKPPVPVPNVRWGISTEGATQSGGHGLVSALGPSDSAADKIGAPPPTGEAKDADTPMRGVNAEKSPETTLQKPDSAAGEALSEELEKASEPASLTASATDAMDVDGDDKRALEAHSVSAATTVPEKPEVEQKSPALVSGGPASGTRSAQSPLVANTPLSAPTSVRRTSRRSSTARKPSADSGDGRAAEHAESGPPATMGVVDDDDGKKGTEKDGRVVSKEGVVEEGDDESITVTSKNQKDDKDGLKGKESVERRERPMRAVRKISPTRARHKLRGTFKEAIAARFPKGRTVAT